MPEEIVETLDRASALQKRSRASLIREALAQYAARLQEPNMEAAFGLWSQKDVDGLSYQEELRKEWL